MNEENRHLVLEMIERWNAGERETVLELAQPDAVLSSTLTQRIYRGHDGVMEWISEIDSLFDRWQLRVDGLEELDDGRIVGGGHVLAQGKASGIALDQSLGWLFVFRDGKIAELSMFLDAADARRAAGLDP